MIPPHIRDHIHPSQDQTVVIGQQYADDIEWISTSKYKTNKLIRLKRNLQIIDPKIK